MITAPEAPTIAPVAVSRHRLAGAIPNVVLSIVFLIVMVPFVWVLLASLRQTNVLTGSSFDFSNMSLANYIRVLEGSFPSNLLNSVIACGVAAILSVGVSASAAYAFSRFTFRGSNALFWLVLVVQVVPAVSMVVPLYKLWADLNLFNNIIGLGIAYAGLNTAVCLLLLKGFIDDIPRELDEAAAIDGCSNFGTFRRVVLPLLAPALTSAGIFVIVTTWQEYVIASSLMNEPGSFTATVGLQSLVGQYTTDYGGIMAGSVLTAIPIIIVFAIFQKQFVQTVTGGLKG
ncbi:ABC-type glycerol-3-phosphate transport system permease component [Nakamurella sp. UYEF19]|uniref:carbohydrate ABC transporter permease n=1 Tax=Nakamurella sp. UYEF19 TaxID=1756392 RepID=UPI003394C4C0